MTVIPPIPRNEQARLSALRGYAILDTPPEETFDHVTELAAQVFDAPIVLVTFIDENRQWFKAKLGWDIAECAREVAFCAYTILQDEV
jgi:hypothetical protein